MCNVCFTLDISYILLCFDKISALLKLILVRAHVGYENRYRTQIYRRYLQKKYDYIGKKRQKHLILQSIVNLAKTWFMFKLASAIDRRSKDQYQYWNIVLYTHIGNGMLIGNKITSFRTIMPTYDTQPTPKSY